MREGDVEISSSMKPSPPLLLRNVRIRLRPAIASDAALLFHWGNEEDVRKGRLSGSQPLEWIDHCVWLQRRIDGLENEQVFMAYYGETTSVGVGRLLSSKESNEVVIGIIVAPEARRSGIGHQIIKLLVDKIKKQNKTPVARVMNHNLSSQRLFKGAGFVFTGGSLGWREYRFER
jgi:RimJ/RimL family protein N-acetyltransferase